MKKKKWIVFLVFLLSFPSFGQDTVKLSGKKCLFSCEVGAAYKGFVKSGYIDPGSYKTVNIYNENQFDRFTRMPAYSINGGILFSVSLSACWIFSTGLMYYLRKEVYRMDIDSVIKYNNPPSVPYISGVFRYNYFYHNLEIPVMFGYKIKRVTFSLGFKTCILSYRKAIYSYVVSVNPQNTSWETTKKSESQFDNAITVFPEVRFSYETKVGSHKMNIFLGVGISQFRWTYLYFQSKIYSYPKSDIANPDVQPSFYLQAGVQVPFGF